MQQTTSLKRFVNYDQQYSWQTLEEETEKNNYQYWLQQHDIAHIARVIFDYDEGYRIVDYQTRFFEETETKKNFYDQTNSKTIFGVYDLNSFAKNLTNYKEYVSTRHEQRTFTMIVNLVGGHWVTLVIAKQNEQYHVFYSDYLGETITPEIKISLESALKSLNIIDLQIKQQNDKYNCGIFALENSRIINEILEHGMSTSHKISKKLHYLLNSKTKRKYFSTKLFNDPSRKEFIIMNFASAKGLDISCNLDGILKPALEISYLKIAIFALERKASTKELNDHEKDILLQYITKHHPKLCLQNPSIQLHLQPKQQSISINHLFEPGKKKRKSLESALCPNRLLEVPLSESSKNKVNLFNTQEQSTHKYSKRSGTSNISGQLYETKLLTMLLFRALNDKKIKRFYLGTNVDGIGALDDIILKYSVEEQEKPIVIFIQAKHRDDPEKEKITVSEMQKINGDFSLHKYLDSYIRIKQKFNTEIDDAVFGDAFENINCNFIIYSPATENFNKKKYIGELHTNRNDLLYTRDEGKTFQFNYEDKDIDILVKTALETRIKLLAESLAKFILSDKYNYINMMSDDFVKTFHVFLAQKVIKVSNNKAGDFLEGKFRTEFLDSKEELLSLFRDVLYKKIIDYNISTPQLTDVEKENLIKEIILKGPTESIISLLIGNVLIYDSQSTRLKLIEKKVPQSIIYLKNNLENVKVPQEIINKAIEIARRKQLESISFKLPTTFGNLIFKLRGNDAKIKKRLYHLTSKFIELLKNTEAGNNEIVKIDNNLIGPDKMLKKGDLDINGGIGGLVGNLLILDEKTEMMKFNNNRHSLPEKSKQFFEILESKFLEDSDFKNMSLTNYKFLININGFPKLSLVNEIYDKSIVREFLDKIKFYTNQAKEDGVEEILKQEIRKHYLAKGELTFDIKNNAIFLDVHDKVQKWWKLPKETHYLTNNCDYFQKIDENIKSSQMSTIFRTTFINKVKGTGIEFCPASIEKLMLKNFIDDSHKQVLNIITKIKLLTAAKVVQSFETAATFIDLHYLSSLKIDNSYLENAINEFKDKDEKINILIIFCSENFELEKVDDLYKTLLSTTDKKPECNIILITQENDHLAHKFKRNSFISKKYEEKRDINSLNDLTIESQDKILNEGIIIFQGEEISLKKLINEESKHVIDEDVLSRFINNEKIQVGKIISNLGKIENYYINRKFNRQRIKLDILKKRIPDLFAVSNITETELSGLVQQKKTDQIIRKFKDKDPHTHKPIRFIVLDNENAPDNFKQLCDEYPNKVIHWLDKEKYGLVWRKSQGILSRLRKHINKRIPSCIVNEDDIISDEIFTIIAAEPGMGKSTVLCHLAKKIKENSLKDESGLWVVRINLNEHSLSKVNSNKSVVESLLAIMQVDVLEEINTLLEKELFKCYFDCGKVVLLFDGFDEIGPACREKAIMLLKDIKKSKVNRLFVTTRTHKQSELEDELETLSYTLKPLSMIEQKEFVVRFWKINFIYKMIQELTSRLEENVSLENINMLVKKISDIIQSHIIELHKNSNLTHIERLISAFNLNKNKEKLVQEIIDLIGVQNEVSEEVKNKVNVIIKRDKGLEKVMNSIEQKAKIFADTIIKKFSKSFSGQKNKFTGIPLHIVMLVEAYQENFEKVKYALSNKFSLLDLYQKFIENKYDLYFRKYLKSNLKTGNKFQDIRYSLTKTLTKEHRSLALDALFSKKVKKTLLVKDACFTNIQDVGVIEKIVNDYPIFIHRMFSEYFAADLFVDKLKKPEISEKFKLICRFLRRYIFKKKYKETHFFFNRMLAGTSKIHISVLNNDKEAVNALLNDGKIINTLDQGGRTALHLAAWCGYSEIVHVLLKELQKGTKTAYGISINDKLFGWSPLTYAVQNGNWDIASSLLDAGAKSNEIIKVQNVNAVGDLNLNRFHLLHFAIIQNFDIDIIKFLVKNGAYDSKDIYGNTSLHIAAEKGRLDIVQYLLDKNKVNTNIKYSSFITLDQASPENLIGFILNIEKRTKLNTRNDNKDTPFHIAAKNGHLDIVKYFVDEIKLDLNIKNDQNNTPSQLAAQNEHFHVVKYIIDKNKINFKIKNYCNYTPSQVAVQNRHKDKIIINTAHLFYRRVRLFCAALGIALICIWILDMMTNV